MEEPGEQCTVVFKLIVTEPASECVCVGVKAPPSPTIAGSETNACKDDSALSSRFLHGDSQQVVGSAMRVKTCFFVKSTNSKDFSKSCIKFFFWLSFALIGQFSPVDFPHKKESNIVKQSALIQKVPVEIFRTFKKLFISCIYTVLAILTHAQR
jgi:hypothetical protein